MARRQEVKPVPDFLDVSLVPYAPGIVLGVGQTFGERALGWFRSLIP
jgi:hypothetical protein